MSSTAPGTCSPASSPGPWCGGESLSSAAGEAAAFVRACAERTATEDLPMREGVDFEPLLGLLIPGKETV